MTAQDIIKRFQLEPLAVEGGLFARHYAAEEMIPQHALPARYARPKLFASAICYLLQPDTQSLLHRLKTDEIYHFYAGAPVSLVMLYRDGSYQVVTLGQAYDEGQVPFQVVPNAVWQGSCLVPGGEWALLGTTMAPAYDDDDFELGEREQLLKEYPKADEWIRRLT